MAVWVRVKEASWRPPTDSNKLYAGLFMASAFCIGAIIVGYFTQPDRKYTDYLVHSWDGHTKVYLEFPQVVGLFFFVIMMVFVNPFMEEFYWRVFTPEVLSKDGDIYSPLCMWGSSIGYGSYHVWLVYHELGFMVGIVAAVLCVIFGLILFHQRKHNGIFNAYLVHFGVDLGQLFMMYLQKVVKVSVVLAITT